ncbi:MAG: holo-ACP synthase [Peptococcaceae bacterium]|nr:holo-ACP synthase [Peptococcaceae bacterium]
MFPGVDIIEISRFDEACSRHPGLLARLFTPRELESCKDRDIRSLAVRFAGKEAILKAFGTGLKGLSWQDIEILNDKTGEPIVFLSEKAQIIAESRGGRVIRISLSHSRDNAVAFAILTP